jgi:hypothetical protein
MSKTGRTTVGRKSLLSLLLSILVRRDEFPRHLLSNAQAPNQKSTSSSSIIMFETRE